MTNEKDLIWLAGYLEGEGSFMKGSPSAPGNSQIQVCSTDEDIIAKVAKIFGVKYHLAKRKTKNPKHKKVWAVKKCGYHAVEIMKKLKPMMGLRRKFQIETAISFSDVKYFRKTKEEIAEIREFCKNTTLTQRQIADKFGCTREWINKIKNGKVR